MTNDASHRLPDGQPGPAGQAGRRELLTVDLQGLKASLLAHGHASGLTAGEVVRQALQGYLSGNQRASAPAHIGAPQDTPATDGPGRTRICLRLAVDDAADLQQRARVAGLSTGAWVIHVMRTGQQPASAANLAAARAALTTSNAELAALSRNLAHLTALLRQGEVRAAQQYREVLDATQSDIRRHLRLASCLLAALQRSLPATRSEADE